ncbi:MAG TPA: Co2+/Mg2+ efflux protein ApaG [Rhodothermales bacterium]
MFPFVATTHEITVSVRPVYLDGESDPIRRRFVFGYHIKIQNGGTEPVQLLRRRWLIRDQDGNVEQVEGAGVVGKQPLIEAGGVHAYSSFSVIRTFEGTMEGTYVMRRSTGDEFEIAIPRFILRAAAN